MSKQLKLPDDVYQQLEDVRVEAYDRHDGLDTIPDRGETLRIVFNDYLNGRIDIGDTR